MIKIDTPQDFNTNNSGNNSFYKFNNCEFNVQVTGSAALLECEIVDCHFKETVSFKINFGDKVIFKKCHFFEDVNFSHSIFDGKAEFIDCIFHQNVRFNDSYFKGKARFYQSKFREQINFNNAKFDDLADFWNVVFRRSTIFYKTDFLGTVVFSSAEFLDNVLFTYTLIDKLIIFRGTIFNKGLDLSLAIVTGKISIFDIRIENYSSVENPEDDDLYEDYVTSSALICDKNKRETFRILKYQSSSQGDIIYSLTFSALEIKSYQDSLHRDIYKKKKWWKSQDYIILILNNISNKHGKSWSRGILFTLGAGLIFFYLSLLSTYKYNFGCPNLTRADLVSNFGNFFISLAPTHKFDYLEKEGLGPFFYMWDFIGRIFVAYGIYQTIQAFRKFKA